MNQVGKPSLERVTLYLIALVAAVQVLANVLPRLLPSLLTLAVVGVVVRLVWFWTGRH